jgi:hypothetical protein
MQGVVQPAVDNGFGDVQVGGDLACRPSQVIRLMDDLAMRWVQPREGFADRATGERVWFVGSGRVGSGVSANLSFGGHELDPAFMT